MTLVVKKFGGTSLGDLNKIAEAANAVLDATREGQPLIVVTSAMGGVTDTLAQMLPEGSHTNAESDVVLTSGEQITAALMALALQKTGRKSRSFLAWQLPFETDTRHGDANITDINLAPLKALLSEGGIPVVAGFQGVTKQSRLTTLGRGGSDVTALALAAWFKKSGSESNPVCHIHTDVDGVYTADPRYVPNAKHLKELPYSVMETLADHGAHILHPCAVRYGRREEVPIYVRARIGTQPGTWVCSACSCDTPLLMARQKGWLRLVTAPNHPQTFIIHLSHTTPEACVHAPSHQSIFMTQKLYHQNKDMLRFAHVSDKNYCVVSLWSQHDSAIDRDSLDHLSKDTQLYIRRHNDLWQIFTPETTSAKVMQYFHTKFYPSHDDDTAVSPAPY